VTANPAHSDGAPRDHPGKTERRAWWHTRCRSREHTTKGTPPMSNLNESLSTVELVNVNGGVGFGAPQCQMAPVPCHPRRVPPTSTGCYPAPWGQRWGQFGGTNPWRQFGGGFRRW
jgi:hypothetical protein